MSRDNTKRILNQAIADLSQFAAIVHQIHWYVRGERFYSIHERMDKFLDSINENIDELAERLIIIGDAPYSTLEEFAENSKLESKKGDYNVSVNEHIERLISSFRYLAELYKEGISSSSDESDDVSEGIFADLLAEVEKNIWMLTATLSRAPEIN